MSISEDIVLEIDWLSCHLKENIGNYSLPRLMKESKDIESKIDWCFYMALIGENEYRELKVKLQDVVGDCYNLLYNK